MVKKYCKILILNILQAVVQIKIILLPQSVCRFYPSCSHYARDAIITHKLSTACVLIIKRLLKCNPLSSFGYDPVPGCDSTKRLINE